MGANRQICFLLVVCTMFLMIDCLMHSKQHFRKPTIKLTKSYSVLYSSNSKISYTFSLSIPDSSTCEEIGALISTFAEPPDVILLDGDLGAGKTTFSRGFISNKLGAHNEAITSPTYLLSNTYNYKSNDDVKEIRHIDLYRLSGSHSGEFSPLDLTSAFTTCISLIEWPNRLPPQLSPSSLHLLNIDLSIVPATDKRKMIFSACSDSTWSDRLRKIIDDGFVDDLLIHSTDIAED